MITDEPQNPYAPPASDINPKTAPAVVTGELATRWQRLGGALFDGLILGVAIAPTFFGSSSTALSETQKESWNPFLIYTRAGTWGLIAAFAELALLALQTFLLAQRGQTIGKIVARTRVVRLDGSPPSFVSVAVLRYWLFILLGFLPWPKLNWLIFTVDSLAIYRKDQRCLHDHIAGTKVVRVRSPSAA